MIQFEYLISIASNEAVGKVASNETSVAYAYKTVNRKEKKETGEKYGENHPKSLVDS